MGEEDEGRGDLVMGETDEHWTVTLSYTGPCQGRHRSCTQWNIP